MAALGGVPFDPKAAAAFDEVAALYDRARPRYPERLMEDVVALSGIVRFAKTSAALAAGGALALFWHGHPRLAPQLIHALNRIYAAGTYLDLLSTYAPVRGLPEAARRRVLEEVRGAVEHQGAVVEAEYTSRLYVAALCAEAW